MTTGRTLERDFEFERPVGSKGLHEPRVFENRIIGGAVLRPDSRLTGEIRKEVSDSLLGILDAPHVDYVGVSRNSPPRPDESVFFYEFSVENDMEVKMPAVPSIRRLNNVESAVDLILEPKS